jgi:hypothetical protein
MALYDILDELDIHAECNHHVCSSLPAAYFAH